jgi:hypothetical protein
LNWTKFQIRFLFIEFQTTLYIIRQPGINRENREKIAIKRDKKLSWKIIFSERIRTFYRRKTNLYEKKNPSICRLPEKFGSPLLPFQFNLETSSFGLVNDLVPNRSYWFLDSTIRIFGFVFTFFFFFYFIVFVFY